MLKIEPLNVLELVSCNPGLQKYRMYTELPYCEICNEYFTNRKALRKHEHTIKVNQYTNVLSKEYLKKVAKNKKILSIKKAKLDFSIEEEKKILEAHLSIISNGINFYDSYQKYICGECKIVFKAISKKDYMHHIYFDHEKLHPTNSHSFLFFSE